MGEDDYLPVKDIAAAMGVSTEAVRRWARIGCPHKIHGMNRFMLRQSEVEEWLKTQKQESEPEPLTDTMAPSYDLASFLDELKSMEKHEKHAQAKAAYSKVRKLLITKTAKGRPD